MKKSEARSIDTYLARLFAPVDAASVVVFRVVFGLAMWWDLLYYVVAGRLRYRYLEPVFLFKYPGFAWVERGSEEFMTFFFLALSTTALLIALGLWYRFATVVFFFGYCYMFLLDAASYNNHNYLVCLIALAMIFVPAHCDGSFDARRRPRLRSTTIPAWGLGLLGFLIGLPYFYGGLAKLNYDWLMRAQPMTLWFSTGGVEPAYQIPILQTALAGYFFSWAGMVFDLAVVPALIWRRTRPFAYAAALLFHLNNAFMFAIGFFPWLMIGATTIFFSPSWPRRFGLMHRPAKKKRPAKAYKAQQPAPPPEPHRGVAVALAVFVIVQLLLPFRHVLYPGHVDWTEQGHRFAWRMKLRDKRGDLRFYAFESRTRKAMLIEDYNAILTPRQRRRMRLDPDLIRQFARVMADRFRQNGQDVEIRVQTNISLNGREPQPMVDPEVDLATLRPVFGRADWIVPLEN